MSNAKKALAALVLLAAAFATGRYTVPTKIEERVVYQEKIVEKKVYVKDTAKKVNKVTIRLVTIKPDGTRTIETKIFDKSEIEITQEGGSTTVSEKQGSSEKVVSTEHDSLLISGAAKLKIGDAYPTYGLMVHKRIIGPFYLGTFIFTDLTVGLSAGLSF